MSGLTPTEDITLYMSIYTQIRNMSRVVLDTGINTRTDCILLISLLHPLLPSPSSSSHPSPSQTPPPGSLGSIRTLSVDQCNSWRGIFLTRQDTLCPPYARHIQKASRGPSVKTGCEGRGEGELFGGGGSL